MGLPTTIYESLEIEIAELRNNGIIDETFNPFMTEAEII